jgi:hypothetical protein
MGECHSVGGSVRRTEESGRADLQFRAELFNIVNDTNLSYPASAMFTGTPSPTTTPGRVSTAGQITTYAAPSREIQLGFEASLLKHCGSRSKK